MSLPLPSIFEQRQSDWGGNCPICSEVVHHWSSANKMTKKQVQCQMALPSVRKMAMLSFPDVDFRIYFSTTATIVIRTSVRIAEVECVRHPDMF